MIVAVVPVLTDGGKDDKPEARPQSSVQASETPGRTESSATGSPTNSQPSKIGSPDAPAPSASLSSISKAIQYTGLVRIAKAGPDLDVIPPKRGTSGQDVVIHFDPAQIDAYSVVDEPRLALWTGSVMPNRQDCSDLLSTQGGTTVEVKKATVVCVRTDAGRIAVLTITSTSDDSSTGDIAQATVWSEVSD
ncbi:hypothetical protein [Streptomyces mirabilis]|uniref:hypothetical protein n=1 Tax=Streptomyces mirabilis TaxID=68239 RepID=UPI0036972D88